jgi:hypothetical protein
MLMSRSAPQPRSRNTPRGGRIIAPMILQISEAVKAWCKWVRQGEMRDGVRTDHCNEFGGREFGLDTVVRSLLLKEPVAITSFVPACGRWSILHGYLFLWRRSQLPLQSSYRSYVDPGGFLVFARFISTGRQPGIRTKTTRVC